MVSSPGRSSELHWSHVEAAAMVRAATAAGMSVHWLAQLHEGHDLSAAETPGPTVYRMGPTPALARAASGRRQLAIERDLCRLLRRLPGAAVVHVGIGAGGSHNVPWLADRLGSRAFAMLRGVEVVCSRGTLIDRDGAACTVFTDPRRCRWCCTEGFWRRPRAFDFVNRADLLAASLLASEIVSVPASEDVALLRELGVPERRVAVGGGTDLLLARCAGGTAAPG